MEVGVHRHAYGLTNNGEHECAETISIADKFEHPAYESVTIQNDITLLRLSRVHPLPRASLSLSPIAIFALALHLTTFTAQMMTSRSRAFPPAAAGHLC